MNKIQQKLRSRAGASMLMAMVFMLFCSFIGGTVLASATANAQRVAQIAEQQDYFLERSAALLATDQLQLDDGKYLRLTVVDQKRTIQATVAQPGIGLVPVDGMVKNDRIITFTVTTNTTLTDTHQLLLECTVWRYLREHVEGDSTTATVILSGFKCNAMSEFLYRYKTVPTGVSSVTVTDTDSTEIGGQLTVSSTTDTIQIPDYIANFSVGRGEDIYDFFLDFGEKGQVLMKMNAFSGENNPMTITTDARDDSHFPGYPDVRITSQTTTTTISWEDPIIEKGGSNG